MFDVVVRNKTLETPNIASFELAHVGNEKMPSFTTGSHIDVHIADGLIRQYSLINHDQSDEFYKIAVLNDTQSRGGSVALHNNVQIGDTLTISEPRNLFPLNVNSDKVMLFAGGIGITPIMSMAIELDSLGVDFELHYHAKSQTEAAFYEQLKNASFAAKVFFHFSGEREKNDAAINSALSTFTENAHLYTCGPVAYMDYVFDSARANSWPEANLHKEIFKAEPKVSESGDGAFKLILSRSSLELEVAADQTALEVIDAAGIAVDVSCEMGICGACLTKVTDGIPDHRDDFLTDAEKAKNDQFTPCCSRALSDTLTLDL
ncbi:PDR/VanB family oxidoreductase [Marinomonas posidonica]|uniref:PDR/VanB family oxidoreductase n=1 Tax=Marinomonas posidonica TaxID=936476 RepID=UPI0037366991